jgi:hypothetical protein
MREAYWASSTAREKWVVSLRSRVRMVRSFLKGPAEEIRDNLIRKLARLDTRITGMVRAHNLCSKGQSIMSKIDSAD